MTRSKPPRGGNRSSKKKAKDVPSPEGPVPVWFLVTQTHCVERRYAVLALDASTAATRIQDGEGVFLSEGASPPHQLVASPLSIEDSPAEVVGYLLDEEYNTPLHPRQASDDDIDA